MPARSRRSCSWCSRMWRSSPPSSRCISNISPRLEAIADAKAEIFSGIVPGGAAVINRDNPHFERLQKRWREAAGVSRIVTLRRATPRADARLLKFVAACRIARPCRPISWVLDVTYKLGAPGRHLVQNSLAVLAAASLAGADLALAAVALAQLAAGGRPRARVVLSLPGRRHGAADRRKLQRQSGLHARGAGAARPVGSRAARPPHRRAWRHAGTRPRRARICIARLGAERSAANSVDLVYCCGPLMAAAVEALPPTAGAAMPRRSAALEAAGAAAIRPGDVRHGQGFATGPGSAPIVEGAAKPQIFRRGAGRRASALN